MTKIIFSARLFSFSMALIVAAALGIASSASAHTGHTANVCSTNAADICAHIGYDELNSTKPATFMVHFMPTKGSPANLDPKLIANVTVALQMNMAGHTHGAPPVTVKAVDDVHYEVSDANFLDMSGDWIVKVGFDFNGKTSEIQIPITVK